MSVINSVLKDLDNKPTAFTPLTAESLPSARTESERKLVNPLLLIALAALIAAYAYGYWLQQSIDGIDSAPLRWSTVFEAEPPAVLESTGAALAASTSMQPESTITPPANAIVGLQINEDQQGMTLEFELEQAARSFLKQRGNNRYVFVMRGVTSEISVPAVSDNPWLEKIAIDLAGEDAEIRFDTQQGVLVESGDSYRDGRYLWRIRLKKSLVAPASQLAAEAPAAIREAPLDADRSSSKAREIESLQEAPVITNDSATAAATSAPVKVQIRPVAAPISDEQRLSLAIKDTRTGNLASARQRLLPLLDGTLDRSARVHLLEIARTSGDGAEFQQILQTALSRYPEDETFALHRANQLFAAQKYHDLIEQLGLIESPSAAMQTLLAASHQRLGQHREAAQYYIEALKQDPRQPRNWISLGISQQHLGDREQALHAFRMAPRSGSLNQRLHEFVQARIQQLSNPD